MRCPKCNKLISTIARFCPHCGKKVPDNLRKQGKFQFWVSIIGLVFLFAGLGLTLYMVWIPNIPESTTKTLNIILSSFVILFALSILILLFFRIIDLVIFLTHHVIFASVFCAVVVIGGGLIYFYITTYQASNYFSDSLSLLQDSLAELEAIKISGDSAIKQGATSKDEMIKVKIVSELVTDRLETMSVPKELTDYKEAVIKRGKAITSAAQDTNIWDSLPTQNEDFQLVLSDKETEQLLELTINRIAELKEFGDTAIKRNDTETMRYIAAKLLVQSYLLNEITQNSEKVQATNEIAASAINFVNGVSGANDEWNNSWQNAQNILGTGITIGEPDVAAEHSPLVQAFYNDCAAKGGIVGGAGTVKTGLPTTEFGYTCEYKFNSLTHGQQPCWDYLTYSGGRYLGGNPGCPTENVLPAVNFEEQPIGENISVSNWDGSYPVATTVNCVSNMPGMPTVFPVNTTIVVSNNIGNDDGTTFTINKDGSGTEVSQYGRQGENFTVSMIGIINYQFYMEEGTAKFNATANLDGSALINDQVYTFSCSGGASSTRQ